MDDSDLRTARQLKEIESSRADVDLRQGIRERQQLEQDDLPSYDRRKAIRQLRDGIALSLQSNRCPDNEIDLLDDLQILRNSTAVHWVLDQQLDIPLVNAVSGRGSLTWDWESPLERGIRQELYQRRVRQRKVMRKKVRQERQRLKQAGRKAQDTRRRNQHQHRKNASSQKNQPASRKKSFWRRLLTLDFTSASRTS